MNGKRALALKREARRRAKDGTIAISVAYNILKKMYKHPHYAPVEVSHPSKPGVKFKGKERLKRLAAQAT